MSHEPHLSLAELRQRSTAETVGLQSALVSASTIIEESNMGDVPTGAGDLEDAEHGLSGGGGGGTDVDQGPPCPYCKFRGEHHSGYGFAAGGLGSYTYCGNEAECGKLIEFGPDLEGLDETATNINAKVDAWRASLPVSEP